MADASPNPNFPSGPLEGIDPAALGALRNLKSLVLLGGSVRTSRLSAAVGRSLLDLPVSDGKTVIGLWQDQAAQLASQLSLPSLPMRVVLAQSSPAPMTRADHPGVQTLIERDPLEFRGTAGVLHDLAKSYQDDDMLLVATGAQLLCEPLAALAAALVATGGQVSLIAHDDGIPSGLMLMRSGCLRSIPEIGFVDLKEQALPAIAAKYPVTVLRRAAPTGLPLRTLADYIAALRAYHRRLGGVVAADPLAEDWLPSFALIEPGAHVGAEARVHDSVVLAGGRVEYGAVVVHSVVCPGGVVRHGQMVEGQIIGAGDQRGADQL